MKQLEIDKSTWHYRLIDLFNMNHSKGLCGYFWQAVLAVVIIAAIILAVCAVAFAWLAEFNILGRADDLSGIVEMFYHIGMFVSFAVVGTAIIAAVLAAMVGFCVGFVWTSEALSKKESVNRRVNITKEFVKAKKQKVCPRLTFVQASK